ncbi:XopAH/AvrB family type III secretion system effector [Xanthomonas euvesicatoria]|uniref:XopAH/AvrB family type III secretion system effector n=1 Tax=Xanthomonas euvesicatoria TaxID=456327 RepID=UPI001C45FFCD|nr:XopAH/AvrB family type III secretion system effector [Xanthomonas euvesicatoria]
MAAPVQMWPAPTWNPYANFDTGAASSHPQSLKERAQEWTSSAQIEHFGVLPGPPKKMGLTRRQQSLIGVARWPDKKYNKDDSRSQMEYGRAFYNESRKLGHAIANHEIRNFNELWDRARDWRCSMAKEDANIFRRPRGINDEFPSTTPLINQYEYIKEKYDGRTDGVLQALDDEGLLPPAREFPVHGWINEEPVRLTKLICSSDPHAHRDQRRYSDLWSRGLDYGEPHYIEHTPSEEVPKILHHVNGLFNHYLRQKSSPEEELKLLGDIHWWLAHAMPDERGSAAKSELCVRAIAQAKGMELPPMRNGLVPDIEAMTHVREKFIENYPTMFE